MASKRPYEALDEYADPDEEVGVGDDLFAPDEELFGGDDLQGASMGSGATPHGYGASTGGVHHGSSMGLGSTMGLGRSLASGETPGSVDGGLLEGGEIGGGLEEELLEAAEKRESQNGFEDALERLKKKRKVKLHVPQNVGYDEAQALIQLRLFLPQVHLMGQMKVADELAIAQRNPKNPAVYRLKLVPKVKRVIIRAGYAPIFSNQAGSIQALSDWLKPFDNQRDRSYAAIPLDIVNCVLECLSSLGTCVTKEQIKETGIGKHVRMLLDTKSLPLDTRMRAQSIINTWVAAVTGSDIKKRTDDDDDYHGAEEAVEVDEHGRQVKKQSNALAVLGGGGRERKKTEQEKSAQWQPQGETAAEFENRMKLRHAVLPMDKPVFDRAAAPASFDPKKAKKKMDPNTALGKIDAQLKKISNPNKKAWKATVGQAKVAGSGIVYNWKQ